MSNVKDRLGSELTSKALGGLNATSFRPRLPSSWTRCVEGGATGEGRGAAEATVA